MELIELNVNTRTAVGKGAGRRLRSAGSIPATLYGPGSKPTCLSVDTKELETLLKKSASIQQLVNLMFDGQQTKRAAMIKDLQRDPVSRDLLHADFYEVSMDRKLRTKVPVVVVGKCVGIENGGMLQIIRRELEVLSLPHKIPNSIELDVTNLNVGGTIHVEDIPTEEGLELLHDVNFTVVTVLSTKKETAAEAAMGEGAEGAAAAGPEGGAAA